jgi:hypothetical protein
MLYFFVSYIFNNMSLFLHVFICPHGQQKKKKHKIVTLLKKSPIEIEIYTVLSMQVFNDALCLIYSITSFLLTPLVDPYKLYNNM